MEEETGMVLPEAFTWKMKALLKEEYEAFAKSYEKERVQGLRINPLKADLESAYQRLSETFRLRNIPWAKEGYYYDGSGRPGRHAFHEAGLYYIQEPSAMAVVELLDPRPGELVLDLCAAPGGKSTQIAGRLEDRGFLLANEIHPARSRILSQNMERMGVANAVVTNEDTGRLARYFGSFFDKIAVDAPCSGEGMFRKDEGARDQWSPDNVKRCASRQQEILHNAAVMLKPGGRLVYSTCTFSPEENEGTVEAFLNTHPEFKIERVSACEMFSPGRPDWVSGGRPELAYTFRIWPHKVDGEGHYLAVLRKEGNAGQEKRSAPAYVKDKAVQREWQEFVDAALSPEGSVRYQIWKSHLILFGDQLYALPEEMIDYKGLRVVRPGLHLGTMKKNRLEPSHALALYLNRNQVTQWYNLAPDSALMDCYLRGEALPAPDAGGVADSGGGADSGGQKNLESPSWCLKDKGWVLMMTDGYSIGWVKLAGRSLKNHYPKGLRRPPNK